MAYQHGKAPSTLRKPFKSPFLKSTTPAVVAPRQSTPGASQQSQLLADERTREKGKGKARDSEIGLVEQVAGGTRAARACSSWATVRSSASSWRSAATNS